MNRVNFNLFSAPFSGLVPSDRINVLEKQYNIGQGGLHLGVIEYPIDYKYSTQSAYIYDCGSTAIRNINNGIDRLIEDLKEFQMLNNLVIFISHFHYDHVNGLNYLAEKLSKIYKVEPPILILPQIDEYEKIFYLGSKPFSSKSNFEEFDYYSFISNPEDYFQDKYRIIYLTNNTPSQSKNTYSHPQSFDNNISDADDFQFKNTSYNQLKWIWKSFYHPMPQEQKDILKEEIIQEGINLNNATLDKQRAIRRIYNRHFNDINLSGICLYSGIVDSEDICGWMNTGDINFNNTDIFNNFKNKYTSIKDNICMFQIPHHGSERSSNYDLLHQEFPRVIKYYLTVRNFKNTPPKNPRISNDYLNNPDTLIVRNDISLAIPSSSGLMSINSIYII